MIVEIIQQMTTEGWVIFVVTILAYIFLAIDIWMYNGISQSFFTWFLWGILDTILFMTTYAEKGEDLAILAGCVIGSFSLSIFLFIIKKRKWGDEENMILGLIFITVIIWVTSWFISKSNTIGIFFAVIAEMLAGIPLMKASWKKPGSRYTLVSYLLFLASYIITLITIETWEIKNSLFSLAFLIYGVGDTSPLIRKWYKILIRYRRLINNRKQVE